MVEFTDIKLFCNQVEKLFQPVKIILYGSYATGHQTKDSDVDILIVVPSNGTATFKAADILKAVSPNFKIDLLVSTPRQIKERLEKNDFLTRDIMTKGKIIYEAAGKGKSKKG